MFYTLYYRRESARNESAPNNQKEVENMLKMFIETLEECRISMKWAIGVVSNMATYAIDKVLSILIGR